MSGPPRAKKALGQNFLVDRNVVSRIVEVAKLNDGDHILEVGPGRGALTAALTEKAASVVCVELDRELVPLLRVQFLTAPNVEIVEGDILEADLSSLLMPRWDGKWKVAANLPYNISSQVLFKFIDNYRLFSLLVLMLQKEVGDRLVAAPGTKEYGILTVFCSLYFDIQREFIVRPGSFQPVPKIDSAVLSFRPLEAPRVLVDDEPFFRRVVKAAFSQRRKTLWNCLKAARFCPDDALKKALNAAGIDPGRRGETLDLAEFAGLAREIGLKMPG